MTRGGRATILETERLALHPLDDADLDFVATLHGDPVVREHYPGVLDRHQSQAWLRKQRRRYAAHGHGMWLCVLRRHAEPVGLVGLTRQPVSGRHEVEIGYMLARQHWKHGYAREAAAGCRDYAFRTLTVSRVISLIRPNNLPSQAVAHAIGMTRSGETMHAGQLHWVFAIDRDQSEDSSSISSQSSEHSPAR